MKVAVVLLGALLVALAAASTKEADEVFLKKQQNVLRLLFSLEHPSVHKEVLEVAKTYDIEKNMDHYRDTEVVKRFLDFYRHDRFLHRDQQLSMHYKKHAYQIRLIFDLFFYAKDYETFYKTAAWVREHLNQGMFYYAFSFAVMNRADTRGIVLPPAYDVWPQLFVHADVIQHAFEAYMTGLTEDKDHPYVVYANYTGYPVAHHPEELVSYFREDVGLSAFYAHSYYRYPGFLTHNNYSDIPEDKLRGYRNYAHVKHLLTRYNMERLSNRLPFVEPVEYFDSIDIGYYPEVRMHNGVEAHFRPEGVEADDYKATSVFHKERRIIDAIDYGAVVDRDLKMTHLTEDNALNILGNIIEGNGYSVNTRLYGHLFLDLLFLYGRAVDPDYHYAASPSVLEFVETSKRDPLFYKILARVNTIFKHYEDTLPPYTKHDIEHPEFKITDMSVDKIVTYFDDFDFSVGNTIAIKSDEDKFKTAVVARTHRLNHKPFNYRLTIKSDKDTDVVVRVFYGPRYNYLGREMTFDEMRERFYLFDVFEQKLHAGDNKVERSTKDMAMYSESAASGRDLWYATEKALKGEKPFVPEDFLRLQRFPQRLAVPKGTRDGMPLRFFAIVTPVTGKFEGSYIMSVTDDQPFDFPFDRRVFDFDLEVPNARFADAVVFHRPTENDTA